MQEAKEVAKRKAKQMEMEKKEAARRPSHGRGSSAGFSGYASLSPSMATETPSFAPPSMSSTSATGPNIQSTTTMSSGAGRGMKLGKKSSAHTFE